eukprot:m.33596 g.33596  ORF g.33596 m.33596 type:complete len:315 (+) comp16844_c0_seq2:203-1147(+)
MERLNPSKDWTPTQSQKAHQPPLEELAKVIGDGLGPIFADVKVEVVQSPDFRQAPFHLAAEGICGSQRLADIGGPPYLVPTPDTSKIYNFTDIASEIGLPGATFIGAGAGSSKMTGCNCELMPNTNLTSGEICTHFAKMVDDKPVLERYSSNEFGLLANVLASEGKPGQVIKVSANGRKGDDNFVTAMRKIVGAHYKDQMVAFGGVFLIEKGKGKLHVMPDFSKTPLTTDADVDEWLYFYEADAPLICLSTFVSHDPGLDLRVEHTHCFSDHGVGGHYHYDTTPTEVEYTGYFTLAESVFRIDAPKNTHSIGRD